MKQSSQVSRVVVLMALMVGSVGALSDFNGDGRSDILWHNTEDGRNILWLMDGGTRTSAQLIQTIPEPWVLGGRSDFDGDGTTDLLWRNTADGRNLMWFFQGGSRSSSGLAPSVVDSSWAIAGTPDIDGDGNSDILWRLEDGRNIVWFMDGASRRDALLLHAMPTSWDLLGTGDFDGDGQDDLLWHSPEDDRNIVWLMGVSGRQEAKLIHNSSLLLGGIADFDADGTDDILWRNTGNGTNVLWFMGSGERSSFSLLASVSDLTWRIAGTRDFDGDGMADIHWRVDDGRNILWFMDGGTRAGAVLTFSVTDSQWVLADVSAVNFAPVADAGSDRLVDQEAAVTLTGTGTDVDGSVVSYAWVQTDGAELSLTGADTAELSFTTPTVTETGSYTFQFTVVDDDGASHEDMVVITVSHRALMSGISFPDARLSECISWRGLTFIDEMTGFDCSGGGVTDASGIEQLVHLT